MAYQLTEVLQRITWDAGIDPPSATDDQLDEIERHTGWRLPIDYRHVVKAHGGGSPNPSTIDFQREDLVFRDLFGTLFFVDMDPSPERALLNHYNVWYMLDQMRSGTLAEWMDFDDRRLTLLPFAGESGSCYLCFDFGADVAEPPILFLDYGGTVPGYDPPEKCISQVASNLTELLSLLKP